MRAVSLFSSIGLAETYLEELGIDIVLANEIDKKRADLYQHLYPKTEMICDNICEDKVTKEIVSKYKNIDILIATPPCQGISVANHKKKNELRRNSLIVDSFLITKKILPKFFVFENVQSFLKTVSTHSMAHMRFTFSMKRKYLRLTRKGEVDLF